MIPFGIHNLYDHLQLDFVNFFHVLSPYANDKTTQMFSHACSPYMFLIKVYGRTTGNVHKSSLWLFLHLFCFGNTASCVLRLSIWITIMMLQSAVLANERFLLKRQLLLIIFNEWKRKQKCQLFHMLIFRASTLNYCVRNERLFSMPLFQLAEKCTKRYLCIIYCVDLFL